MVPLSLPHATALRAIPRWLYESVVGLLYWAAFLLVLEPGNLLRAYDAGQPLALGSEALRILVAALLGASVTPIVYRLTRRFPLFSPMRWRHVLVHLGATTGLTLWLILISCFLAAWIYHGRWLPTVAELRDEYTGNGLLLVFALLAFIAGLQAWQLAKAHDAGPAAAPSAYLSQIAVKLRGHTRLVDIATVDWIEAQGNYIALHVGAAHHLVRESLGAFARQIDSTQFVRIHRGAIVAVDRIRSIKPIANGDAALHLADGTQLRISRSYRKEVAQRWMETSAAR